MRLRPVHPGPKRTSFSSISASTSGKCALAGRARRGRPGLGEVQTGPLPGDCGGEEKTVQGGGNKHTQMGSLSGAQRKITLSVHMKVLTYPHRQCKRAFNSFFSLTTDRRNFPPPPFTPTPPAHRVHLTSTNLIMNVLRNKRRKKARMEKGKKKLISNCYSLSCFRD